MQASWPTMLASYRVCQTRASRVAQLHERDSLNPTRAFFWPTVYNAVRCREICGLRPAAARWGQHTQGGKAKYPSILGGRETHEIRTGGRGPAAAGAGGRIGSYAYGDRVMSCRHARSAPTLARPFPNPLTKLRANKGRKIEKWDRWAHSPRLSSDQPSEVHTRSRFL